MHPPPTANARGSAVLAYANEHQYDDSVSYGEDEEEIPAAKEPSKDSESSVEVTSQESEEELSIEQSVDQNMEQNHIYQEKTLIIQNWLITEHTPMFESNDQIKAYLSSDKDLEIFYQLILNPFKIVPSDKVKRRLSKSTAPIHIEQRRTFVTNVKFNYVPSKHNLYFLRGQKMLLVLMLRKNLKTLQDLNPFFMDIFFGLVDREVFQNERSRADMVQILTVVQYFLNVDAERAIRNIIKYHVIYELLGNIEIVLAKETLIGLLTPGDQLFKIRDKERDLLMKYLQMTGFSHTLCDAITEFRVKYVMTDKTKASRDERVKQLIEPNPTSTGNQNEAPKPPNIFVGFFHTLFKFSKKLLKQPEDMYSNVLDIDRLRDYSSTNSPTTNRLPGQSRMSMRFKFPRSTTPANLSGLLDEVDKEETTGRGPSLISDLLAQAGQLDPHDMCESPVDDDNRPFEVSPDEDLEVLQKPNKRSKAAKRLRGAIRFVMCYNLFLSRPQKASKMKKDKFGLNLVDYPEHIRIANQELKTLLGQQKFRFDKCLKRESKSSKVMDVVWSIVWGCISQKNYPQLLQATRQNVCSNDWVQQIYFQDERMIVETLQQFLIKIQYHLENKTLFSSGYMAGKIFLIMCSEM